MHLMTLATHPWAQLKVLLGCWGQTGTLNPLKMPLNIRIEILMIFWGVFKRFKVPFGPSTSKGP